MPPRKPIKSAGDLLIERINEQVSEGCAWSPSELVVLDQLRDAEDRRVVIKALFDAAVAEGASASDVMKLAVELRQLSAFVTKVIASLQFDASEPTPVSKQHSDAVRARWARERRAKARSAGKAG